MSEGGSTGRPEGKADLHIHTALGDGMAELPELLDYVEQQTDLDVIAVTDHDDIRGGLQARELWARGRYRFQVVVGAEVTAIQGHVLALFVEEPVPSLRPVEEILEAVHRQGGLCVVPHPLAFLTRSIGQRTLERIAATERAQTQTRVAGARPGDGVYFDGIELGNGTFPARMSAGKARWLNRERYHLAEVGGSDAHFLKAVGSASTLFPGTTAEDLRRAILERRTSATTGHHPTVRELGVRQVLRQTWRGLMVTPRTMGWGPTAKSFIQRIFPFVR
ncbi:MAG TPA: PHP domain-containing protein [Dehalococcoidia bacterium]|nr:PHP domain-containing protein [Dehalococcoidia bacterium]